MRNNSYFEKWYARFSESLWLLALLSLVIMLSGCATMIKKTLPPPPAPTFQYKGVSYAVFLDSNQVSRYNKSIASKRYFVSITFPKAPEGENLVPQKTAKAVAFDYMKRRVCKNMFSSLKPVFDHKFDSSSFFRGGYFRCAKQ